MKLIVYDFDKTIYPKDSSIDFYFFCLTKHPKLILNLPHQVIACVKYKLKKISKKQCKEIYFSFLKNVDNVDDLIKLYWLKNRNKIQNWFNSSENTVIISASPEFLLEEICQLLNIKYLIATKVNKKTGKFLSENCYGEEKVDRLKKEFKDFKVEEFYSDSDSDYPLKEIANKAYKIKKGKVYEW